MTRHDIRINYKKKNMRPVPNFLPAATESSNIFTPYGRMNFGLLPPRRTRDAE